SLAGGRRPDQLRTGDGNRGDVRRGGVRREWRIHSGGGARRILREIRFHQFIYRNGRQFARSGRGSPMAGADRAEGDAVALYERLQHTPHQFDFFQALRRLECARRDKPRWGESLRPADDPVRFCQEASLAFANCTLPSFAPGKNGRAWRLATSFLGFLGPNGPLPGHLTEFARERSRNCNDPTFVRFLDVFVHRLVSLFYRARAMAEPTFQYDRPDSERFALYVGALCGLGPAPLRNRDAVPDHAKLHFAGPLGCASRSAVRLQSILRELLGVPAAVEEFVAHWMRLPEDCRCQLGSSPSSGTLGVSAILGDRVLDCQHKFRVVV